MLARPVNAAIVVAFRGKRMADVSQDLKAWRERLGITQARAAELLDVSPRTYQGWEAGRDFDRYRILMHALNDIEKNAKKLL